MREHVQHLINTAYSGFNSRDIDAALSTFHKNVEWPRAFEGGYISGHEEIRKYWTKQWTEINPNVQPLEISEGPDGTIEVKIRQLVKDLDGNIVFDGLVIHIYTIEDKLLRRMEIKQG